MDIHAAEGNGKEMTAKKGKTKDKGKTLTTRSLPNKGAEKVKGGCAGKHYQTVAISMRKAAGN